MRLGKRAVAAERQSREAAMPRRGAEASPEHRAERVKTAGTPSAALQRARHRVRA